MKVVSMEQYKAASASPGKCVATIVEHAELILDMPDSAFAAWLDGEDSATVTAYLDQAVEVLRQVRQAVERRRVR